MSHCSGALHKPPRARLISVSMRLLLRTCFTDIASILCARTAAVSISGLVLASCAKDAPLPRPDSAPAAAAFASGVGAGGAMAPASAQPPADGPKPAEASPAAVVLPLVELPSTWATFRSKDGLHVRYPAAVFTPIERGADLMLESKMVRDGLYGQKGPPKYRFAIALRRVDGSPAEALKPEPTFATYFPAGVAGPFKSQPEYAEMIRLGDAHGYRILTGAEGYNNVLMTLSLIRATTSIKGATIRVYCATLGQMLRPEIAETEQRDLCTQVASGAHI
jgi:hypothetical protein